MSNERISTNELRRLQDRDSQCAAITVERDRYKAALEKIAAHDNENAFLAMKQMEIYAREALKEK